MTSSSVSKIAFPEISRIKDQGFIVWKRDTLLILLSATKDVAWHNNGLSVNYDLVGFKDYLFLKKKLPNIDIYIPENLPDLLKRYGKPEKLNSSTSRKII